MPRYLEALEAQVDLARRYSGAGLIQAMEDTKAVFGAKSEAAGDLTKDMVKTMGEMLPIATTFYLHKKVIPQIAAVPGQDLKAALWDLAQEHGTVQLPHSMFVYMEQQLGLSFPNFDGVIIPARAFLFCTWPGLIITYVLIDTPRGLEIGNVLVWTQRDNLGTMAAKAMADFCLSFWWWIQQKVASGFHAPVHRGLMRRAQRAEIEDPSVVVITLRKTMRRDALEGGIPSPVAWTHQYDVEAHSHNYWVGSMKDGTRRLEPRWVDTYRKGPEGLPYIKKSRIRDVRR